MFGDTEDGYDEQVHTSLSIPMVKTYHTKLILELVVEIKLTKDFLYKCSSINMSPSELQLCNGHKETGFLVEVSTLFSKYHKTQN